MTFIVEDGSSKVDANSYGSVEGADAYFLERGVTDWAGTSTVKQSALINATDYMESRFGGRYIGTKATDTQALEWPRLGIAFPEKLRRACYEYALRALTSKLAPDINIDSSGMVLAQTKTKVGPIESEFTVVGTTPTTLRPYPAADMLLRGLVNKSNRVSR